MGQIYPATIEDMVSCFKDLDAGNDPVTNGWEDEDPKWIAGIEARAIGIEFGEYPAECAKYFLTD